jgi:hypothetical protein
MLHAGVRMRSQRSIPAGTSLTAAHSAGDPMVADNERDHVLRVRVVDETNGHPVPAAIIQATFPLATDVPRQGTTTDESGEATVSIHRLTSTHVSVIAEGHAWAEATWDAATLPRESSFALEPATHIGGIVVNQRGAPVRGARIRLIHGAEVTPGFDEFYVGHSEYTDDEGRWDCAHVPAQLERLLIQVFHPDHAVATFALGSGDAPATGMLVRSQLEARSAVMLLRQGITVAGKVVNQAGHAVEGARITGGPYPAWSSGTGEFRLPQCPPGPLEFVVEASGFSPVLRQIEVSDGLEEQVIALTRVLPLRLRIVDSGERPLSAATVRLVPSEETALLSWHAESDDQGRVAWSSPPIATTRFRIARQGYEPVTLTMTATDGPERTIRLHRPLQISGQVVDAQTQQPITSFRIIPGRFHDDHHHWEEDRAMTGDSGRFRIDLRGDGLPHAVKVEADGYYPAISRNYEPQEEFQQHRFELVPGTPIRGVVRSRDGKPVPGAQVGLATPRHSLTLGPARFMDHDHNRIVISDALGHFHFQPQREPEAIYVAHELGFAEVRLDATELGFLEIALQDWSQIEGRLESVAGPVGNRIIALVRSAPDGLLYHANHYTALTDPQGRFSIARVPPGEHWLVRIIRGQASHAIAIVTQPGRTVPLDVAVEGRLVTGQVRLNPSLPNENWLGNHPGFLRRLLPALEPPAFPDEATHQAWHREWARSVDGRRRALDQFPFVLSFEADGRFQVEDVPPGTYTLEVHYHDPISTTTGSNLCRGVLQTQVTVPATVAGAVADPVDLGQFRVPLRSEPGIHTEPPL